MIKSCLTGTAIRMSPSSYLTAEDCWLKWWFNKVAGHITATTPRQQLGIDVHTVLEHYSETGEAPDESTLVGRIAASGLAYLPEPKTYHAEYEVHTTCGPIPFKGIVDAYSGTHVLDHKTTSSLRWALNSCQLAHAPQPLAYIASLQKVGKMPEADTYDVSFVYYLTTGIPMAQRVDAVVSHEDVLENWKEMEEAAKKMMILAGHSDPLTVPYNVGACKKYGGCDFKDFCPRNPNNEHRMELTMNDQQQRLQAFMRGDEPKISPDDATPSPTPTDQQLADALEFATNASAVNGKLDDKVLLAIIKRFQLPETEVAWLKTALAASVQEGKALIEIIPDEEAKAPAKKPRKKRAKKTPVVYVYVDCMPDEGVDTTLDKLAYPFEQEVTTESAKYNDGDAVGHYAAIAYGKGKAEVLARISAHLIGGVDFETIFVSSRHTLAGNVISLLSNLPNSKVRRGVR